MPLDRIKLAGFEGFDDGYFALERTFKPKNAAEKAAYAAEFETGKRQRAAADKTKK